MKNLPQSELNHAKELAEVTKELAVGNQQANEYRDEANRLNAELLKVHKEFMQPGKGEK